MSYTLYPKKPLQEVAELGMPMKRRIKGQRRNLLRRSDSGSPVAQSGDLLGVEAFKTVVALSSVPQAVLTLAVEHDKESNHRRHGGGSDVERVSGHCSRKRGQRATYKNPVSQHAQYRGANLGR